MPKKSLGQLTEPMFYMLMAFREGPKCGAEISQEVYDLTKHRVKIGPATLYTLLPKFVEAEYIVEVDQGSSRKRTYVMTKKGIDAYTAELKRLRACLLDAQEIESTKSKDNKQDNNYFKNMSERYRNPGQSR